MAEKGKLGSRLRSAWERAASLPTPWKVGVTALLLASMGAAGLYMYRTYDYVQHDNQFCMSCHLMADPYERFARSAHRDLSCKACHQPTFAARTQMALEQIVERPDTLATHAEVPNERCAECHIEGDPEQWRLIRNTAGHQVHLESEEPELQGLQCVECHSTSLHEFAPTNRTCGQAGCHEGTRVTLGAMGDLTIHCVACHQFTEPVQAERVASDQGPEAVGPLTPVREDCLGCHQMRRMLADLPADEPHDAQCGVCHNPHEQEVPAEAAATCTDSGCHSRVDTISNFHHQRPGIRLDDCAQCHRAHQFRVDEENCLGCHEDIFERERGPARSASSAATGARSPRSTAGPRRRSRDGTGVVEGWSSPSSGPAPSLLSLPPRRAADAGTALPKLRESAPGRAGGRVPALAADARDAPAQEAPRDTTRFRHDDHSDIECQTCHESGQPTVTTNPRWCRDCHHTGRRSASCQSCHRPGELRARSFGTTRTLRFSVSDDSTTRTLPFRHEPHTELECSRCHTGRPALSAADAPCSECHAEHHEPEATCTACHLSAPEGAHPREDAHLTCTGSGCHEPAPFADVPRTRNACLSCHREMTDHETGRDCAECHALPSPHPQEATS